MDRCKWKSAVRGLNRYNERNMMNQVESIYLGFWAAVTGAVCGSFVCCMTERIYDKRTLGGRSRCPGCGHTLGVMELIPVFSWLIQKGRADIAGKGFQQSVCGQKSVWQYFLQLQHCGLMHGIRRSVRQVWA